MTEASIFIGLDYLSAEESVFDVLEQRASQTYLKEILKACANLLAFAKVLLLPDSQSQTDFKKMRHVALHAQESHLAENKWVAAIGCIPVFAGQSNAAIGIRTAGFIAKFGNRLIR